MHRILAFWTKFLGNQRGEVPMSADPAPVSDTFGPIDNADNGPPVSDVAAPADPQAAQAQPEQVESFIDPSTLPEELKPHWKRMHGQYTKFAQERKTLREAGSTVERFNQDPDFAFQVMQARAAQLGYQVVKPGQVPQQGAAVQGADGIPPEYINAIQNKLPPELHWMAPALAQATFHGAQTMLAPLQQKQEQERLAQRDREFDEHEAKLNEKFPGWEEHEDAMNKLWTWLKSDSLSHPLYGSKLEILYSMATEQAKSVSEAAKRLNAAARNRSSSSQVTSQSAPNITKRVREAKSDHEAWAVAAEHAMQSLGKRGG